MDAQSFKTRFSPPRRRWPRCTSCHAGYGWRDENFDFSDSSKIDCLVCHDTTGKYKKAPPAAGFPEKNLDLASIAQNVGRPSRSTCGMNCHFRGGGGDAVKHGDIQPAVIGSEPRRPDDGRDPGLHEIELADRLDGERHIARQPGSVELERGREILRNWSASLVDVGDGGNGAGTQGGSGSSAGLSSSSKRAFTCASVPVRIKPVVSQAA